jgi:hypothetical protein
MEILGRNLSQIQYEISSAYESATEAVAQTTKAAEMGNIQSVFENFSGMSANAEVPASLVAGPAQFPDPASFLSNQPSGDVSNAAFAPQELVPYLQDSRFVPEQQLASLDLNGHLQQALSPPGWKQPVKEAREGMADPVIPRESFVDLYNTSFEHKYHLQPGPTSLQGTHGLKREILVPVSERQTTFEDPDRLNVALPAPNTGGKNEGEQRGIIIIGGKTEGTSFQTIDDTIAGMQEPGSAQLFAEQFGAVQDLAAKTEELVEMQKQFAMNFTTKLWR